MNKTTYKTILITFRDIHSVGFKEGVAQAPALQGSGAQSSFSFRKVEMPVVASLHHHQ